ncbi:MAG: cytochrome c [Caldilineaceae bacterium]|nr:cytochrome c [Caldilineaceae bacterium]
MSTMRRFCFWIIPASLIVLLLAACGSQTAQSPDTVPASLRPVATMPPARFTAVSAQNTFTETVRSTPTSAVSVSDAAPAPDLSRGATVYNNRCASCHGDQGQGVAGRAEPITEFELSYSEFEALLRTGGSGRLGNEHLFGPSAVSPSGMQALYAYVQSLLE